MTDSAYFILCIDCMFCTVVSLFCYCLNILITVLLILEMYSKSFDLINNNIWQVFSINIIHLNTCTYFRLSIGFSNITTIVGSMIFGTNFSSWGEKGETRELEYKERIRQVNECKLV
jgi:hypothetical protein